MNSQGKRPLPTDRQVSRTKRLRSSAQQVSASGSFHNHRFPRAILLISANSKASKDEPLPLASVSHPHVQSSSAPCSTTQPACPENVSGHLMRFGYSWIEEWIKAHEAQSEEIAALKLADKEQKVVLASQGGMVATLEKKVASQQITLGYQDEAIDNLKRSLSFFTIKFNERLKKGQEALDVLDRKVEGYEKALNKNKQSLDKMGSLRVSDLFNGVFGK